MNARERFLATMHYQPRDRACLADFGFWGETFEAWYRQGLPRAISPSNSTERFGMDFDLDAMTAATGIDPGLCPPFEEIIFEDRGDAEVVQQEDGVRVLRKKAMSSIPMHLAHLLTDRQSWREHYRPRLDPDHPARYPEDMHARAALWRDPNRQTIIALNAGSLYGWLRNWMGVENLSLVVYDDPVWFEEMVTTVADCIVGTLTRALQTGGRFDAAIFWEDMCYNSGPLLSPKHVAQFLVPHYRRIVDLLNRHGVDSIGVDCDGQIDLLIPLWLDAGVTCMYPLEVGTWGGDPVRYRREYGKELLIMGGFDKHILARDKSDVEREIARLTPLVEDGGYIAFCDHRVPPDVPLENYMFYLKTIRREWGRNINLKPIWNAP